MEKNMIQNEQLCPELTLYDCLKSETAERQTALNQFQFNPPQEVVENMRYWAKTVYHEISQSFCYPIGHTSIYRCEALNSLIGGTKTSQHVLGQAGDLNVNDSFLNDPKTQATREMISREIKFVTGKELRHDVNANFYLFAFVSLKLTRFDIDQIIHEYGRAKGQPAWVHISGSKQQNLRQIKVINGAGLNKTLTLKEALELGCQERAI